MVKYTIATKGIHGGYSNISKSFDTKEELKEYLKERKSNNNNFKFVKITWLDKNTCKEEYIESI